MKTTYYKTSDGNIFYTKNAAENHARSLSDRSVVSASTPQEEAPKVEEVKEDAPKVDVVNQEELDLLTKADLLLIAEPFNLELTMKNTKAQIIEQINQLKKSE